MYLDNPREFSCRFDDRGWYGVSRDNKPDQVCREAREGEEKVKSSGWIVSRSQQCNGFLYVVIKAALTTPPSFNAQPWDTFMKQKIEGGSSCPETCWGKNECRHFKMCQDSLKSLAPRGRREWP